MKTYQKGYLELNRIWMSRQEYEAHQKRLDSIKHPRLKMNIHQDYNNQKERLNYYKMKNEQLINNRKKELYRWQDIQEKNDQFLKRLQRINSRQSSPFTPPHSKRLSPKGSVKRIQIESQLKIDVENKRLQQKLVQMEACIKSSNFSHSFEQHKKYKENMQKFTKEGQNSKIKLRVDKFIDTLQTQKQRIQNKVAQQPSHFVMVGNRKNTNVSVSSMRQNDRSEDSVVDSNNTVRMVQPSYNPQPQIKVPSSQVIVQDRAIKNDRSISLLQRNSFTSRNKSPNSHKPINVSPTHERTLLPRRYKSVSKYVD